MLCSQKTFDAARAQVAYAYDQVRFFRRHMDRAGLHPQDIAEPADLRRIPPTSKTDYRKNFPVGVLARGKSLRGRFVHQSHSSGTSGERLTTVAHSYRLAQRMENTMSVHPAFADFLTGTPRRRTCRYAAPNCSDVECATPNSTVADRLLPDGTLVLPVYHDLLATTEPMVEQAMTELIDYQPHWLYIDPTHLAFLVRHMRRRGIDAPTLGAIAMTYTMTTQVARRQISGFFAADTPIAEVLSMSEFGWLGMECPIGTMHLNNRSFYLELVVDDRSAEPGEMGELVVTSTDDLLSPHIRYRTGDFYTLLGECPCGHEHVAVRSEGRRGNFITRDGHIVLTPRGLDDRVGPAPGIDVYKLEQRAETDLVVRYVANEQFAQDAIDELADELRAAVGDDIRLTMERTEYIAGERSGKFMSCVSALASPAV